VLRHLAIVLHPRLVQLGHFLFPRPQNKYISIRGPKYPLRLLLGPPIQNPQSYMLQFLGQKFHNMRLILAQIRNINQSMRILRPLVFRIRAIPSTEVCRAIREVIFRHFPTQARRRLEMLFATTHTLLIHSGPILPPAAPRTPVSHLKHTPLPWSKPTEQRSLNGDPANFCLLLFTLDSRSNYFRLNSDVPSDDSTLQSKPTAKDFKFASHP